MPDRREMLLGGLAAGAFGMAEFLRPRRIERLFTGMKLEDALPKRFGPWSEHPGGAVIAPVTPDSLADRLYSATVSRVYFRADGPPVMLLVAYGGEQSDLLQLHRPEACYPAVGMEITQHRGGDVPLGPGRTVPAVFLSAAGLNRVEDIVYWTRLGEAMPRSAGEQRSARLKAAMQGSIGDGILVRASTIRFEQGPAWPYLAAFLRDMVASLPDKARPGFVGTRLSGLAV